MKLSPEGKKNIVKPVEGFTKIFKRHTALNPEHKNLLIFIQVENLPDVKKQTEDNTIDEWVSPLISFMLQLNSLRN